MKQFLSDLASLVLEYRTYAQCLLLAADWALAIILLNMIVLSIETRPVEILELVVRILFSLVVLGSWIGITTIYAQKYLLSKRPRKEMSCPTRITFGVLAGLTVGICERLRFVGSPVPVWEQPFHYLVVPIVLTTGLFVFLTLPLYMCSASAEEKQAVEPTRANRFQPK